MDDLVRLAELVKARNKIAVEISAIIGRPAQIGHLGEFVASRIFDVSLEESATRKGRDGHFSSDLLGGRSVNVKWYGKQEGILDINLNSVPDYYLVLAGPKSGAVSLRGKARPWVINSVYLFDAHELVDTLRRRGLKIGVATSVRQQYWQKAMLYPAQNNHRFILTDEQRLMLALFR